MIAAVDLLPNGYDAARGSAFHLVINETMARKYWGGADPIGRTLSFGAGPAVIVGVARDGKYERLNEEPRNYIYVPIAQFFRHDALVIVRTAGDRCDHS